MHFHVFLKGSVIQFKKEQIYLKMAKQINEDEIFLNKFSTLSLKSEQKQYVNVYFYI